MVDLRDRTAYAAEHVHGTIGIALGDQFCTYLGWLIPWDTPLTLLGENARQVADAQRQLVRIGIDRPAGAALGHPADLALPDELACTYPVATFADLRAACDRASDWWCSMCAATTNAPAATIARIGPPPPQRAFAARWGISCTGHRGCTGGGSAFRASIAASLLARAGHNVVLVDDNYNTAVTTGLATG